MVAVNGGKTVSTIRLQLPDSLHAEIRKLAERENVSINQLATLATAEKNSRFGDGRLSVSARIASGQEEVLARHGHGGRCGTR